MKNDEQLLREFVDSGSEEAFRDLVERYAKLVYSVARRRMQDEHSAEDVTQSVFLILAQKSKRLPREVKLSAWLFQVTRNVCADMAKAAQRRTAREMKAAEWKAAEHDARSIWAAMEPVLDEGMAELATPDRDSLLLRFFQEQSFAEMAQRLSITEDAAKKRVSRAIGRLREFFIQRGITVSCEMIGGLLASQAVQPVPASMSAAVVAHAVMIKAGETVASATSGFGWKGLTILSNTQVKAAVITAGLVIAAATTVLVTSRVVGKRLRTAAAAIDLQRPTAREGSPATNAAAKTFDWRQVESDDYKTYIANLRAIGCPEETIRDIIVADVDKLYSSRAPALPANIKFEYWKSTNSLESFLGSEETLRRQHEVARQKQETLKALLGTDAPETTADATMVKRAEGIILDFLPEERRQALIQLENMFDARMAQARGQGQPDVDAYKEMDRLAREKDGALEKLLSPEEKFEYDVRMSRTATMLRSELVDFNPTEAEFREIFKLQQGYYKKVGSAGEVAVDQETSQLRGVERAKMEEEVRGILGEDRFGEYVRSQDPAYQTALRIVERQGLDRSIAAEIYTIKSQYENELLAIESDSSLSAAEQQKKQDALRAATEKLVGDKLGAAGLNSYRSNPGAWWLQKRTIARTR